MGRDEVARKVGRPARCRDDTDALPGECLLAGGLACLALGCGLVPFVMIGLLGIAFCGAGFALLLVAGILLRDAGLPAARAVCGLGLFLAGVIVLVLSGLQASDWAYEAARAGRLSAGASPAAALWPAVIGPAVASFLVALGLRLRAGWPVWRLLPWLLAVLAVCPAARLLFFGLVPALPLDT